MNAVPRIGHNAFSAQWFATGRKAAVPRAKGLQFWLPNTSYQLEPVISKPILWPSSQAQDVAAQRCAWTVVEDSAN